MMRRTKSILLGVVFLSALALASCGSKKAKVCCKEGEKKECCEKKDSTSCPKKDSTTVAVDTTSKGE